MAPSATRVLGLLAAAASIATAQSSLTKDVVIIGGGAAGAHAAIRLREDFGKSIALIEKQEILVRAHHPTPTALNMFGRPMI